MPTRARIGEKPAPASMTALRTMPQTARFLPSGSRFSAMMPTTRPAIGATRVHPNTMEATPRARLVVLRVRTGVTDEYGVLVVVMDPVKRFAPAPGIRITPD